MNPARTSIERPETRALVSIEEARAWIGLYGDTSVDSEVAATLNASIEVVSNWLGAAITRSVIFDWYPKTTKVFHPSQPGVLKIAGVPQVELHYYDGENVLTTVLASKYEYDPTVDTPVFSLVEDYAPSVSEKYEFPWRLKYTNSLDSIRDFPAIDSIKMAIRVMVTRYWQHRGRIDPNPHATDKAISSILGPAKTTQWYLKAQGVA